MSPKWKLCDKIDIFMYSRGVIIVWFNYTPPRKQETSNFRGIVPIQFLISIKLSLKWALDEVSTIKLMFPCALWYNGIFLIFGHLWRLVAGRSSDIFQFRFLQSVLHKNEKLLRWLTEIFRIMDPPYYQDVQFFGVEWEQCNIYPEFLLVFWILKWVVDCLFCWLF